MKRLLSAFAAGLLVTGVLLPGVLGCNVRKQGEGSNQKLDVKTPMGSFHVDNAVDPRKTGIPVYPGAKRIEDQKEEDSANLNIDSSLFGLKLVAVKYRSEDPPQKLLDFYQAQLKSYGSVSVCRGGLSWEKGKMQCRTRDSSSAGEIQLVVGPEDRQRIVDVRPYGKGSEFSLVYVQMHGGEKETM